ncbi:MAG: YbaY family lipoprotein [Cellvibrio sp.]|uniref:YbaY family lipoprotein n=1 Tax=Cellvibrio sp. TaxID=1965322 RepID=UPI0031ACF0AC
MKKLCVLIFGLLALAQASSAAESVKGSVTYLQRIAMPAGALLEVSLVDISRADAPASIVGTTQIYGPFSSPVKFRINVDPEKIDAKNDYAVRATIRVDGKLYMTTDKAYLVLTKDRGNSVELAMRGVGSEAIAIEQPLEKLPAYYTGVLPCADCEGINYQLQLLPGNFYFLRTKYAGKRKVPEDEVGRWLIVDRNRLLLDQATDKGDNQQFRIVDNRQLRKLDVQGQDIVSNLNYSLLESTEKPFNPSLSMKGLYTHTAGAGQFTDCITGQRWPVAHEGKNANLEKSYGKKTKTPGSPLLVSLKVNIVERPTADTGTAAAHVLVKKVKRVSKEHTCDSVTGRPATAKRI